MIYIFDKTQAIIKVLTNDDFTAAHLNFKINMATTFEFSLPASKALPSDSKYVATPHPLDDSKFIMLRLTERVDNTETIDYSAYELAYQELATDGYIEDKRPQNQSALNLMKMALDGTNWELNNVNVSGTATTNFYYVDRLSAISKVVDLLGGEIVFYIEIQGNAISGRYMDYLARQGADTSKVFASGSNLLTVERQSDTSNIYTAILPRGKGEEIDNGDADTPDGYGRRINIADVEWKKSSGNLLDKPKGSIVLSDPDATAEWGQINGNTRLLLQTYDDIDDVNVLINSAYKTLQSVNHPQIQYSATVADVGGLSLGDTVLIMHGDRDLSYKTRVFEVKYDLLAPDQTELSLGDDLSSNSITSQINSLNAVAETTSSQTQWTINQIGRPGTTYGETAPDSPKVRDIWFKYLPDGGMEIYRWNGDIWELLASPTTADDIANAVTDAVTQAKAHTDEVKQSLSSDIETAKSQAASQANTAEANAKSEATSLFSRAQNALSDAKTELTNSIASESSKAVAAANSQAQSYANQAKADAMSAASSADGVIRTAINSSANSLSAAITQNKSSADSGISTAQTTAKAALDGLEFKVSKTDYDQKTGDLSTKINDVKQTADSSAQTIADIKIADGKQDARMSEIENTASGLKSTVSDLKTTQGKQSGDISTLQQRADGFDATVTKVNNFSVGGRNLLLGTRDWTDNTRWNQRNKVTTDVYRGMVIASSSSAWSSPLYLIQNAGILQVGKTYTFSTYVRNTSDTDTKVTSYYDSGIVTPNAYKIPLPAHTDWIRVSTTFKVIKDPTTSTLGLRWEGENGLTNGFIQFAGYKLEEGNLPTDWTPAPEDLSSATAKAQLTADNAALAVGKLTSADGVITKAQADIKANATAITTKVSQTDYDKKNGELSGYISTLKQRADGFDATVTKVNNFSVGGRNYVLNTNVSTTSNITGFYSSVPSSYFNNKKLTVSVQLDYDNITALSDQKRLGVEFVILNKDGSNRYVGSWKYPAVGDSFHGRIYTTWDFSNNEFKDIVANQMGQGIYVQGITGTNVSVSKPKLEIGTSSTDWSPAPEDIESSLAQVKLTADSISNFVRDSSGNISYEFQTAFSKTSIITGSTLASSIQKQTSSQIASALTDNNGKIISLINQDSSGVQISGKNIILDGNTTVTGDFYAQGGNFKNLNASNMTVGTLNGSQVNITNVNVNSLVGNVSSFIQSNWNGKYSSTTITELGMTIGEFPKYGYDTTFDKTGMTFTTKDARYDYAKSHFGTNTIVSNSNQIVGYGTEISFGTNNGVGFDYFAIMAPGDNNLQFGKFTAPGHVSIAITSDKGLSPFFGAGVNILDDVHMAKGMAVNGDMFVNTIHGANAFNLFNIIKGQRICIPTSFRSNGTAETWLNIQM